MNLSQPVDFPSQFIAILCILLQQASLYPPICSLNKSSSEDPLHLVPAPLSYSVSPDHIILTFNMFIVGLVLIKKFFNQLISKKLTLINRLISNNFCSQSERQ